jgi:hypothetical protein
MVTSTLTKTNLDYSVKNNVIQKIELLPDNAILEVLNFIEFLTYKYVSEKSSSLWSSIEKWRNKLKSENCNDDLSNEMIAGWRSKDLGREFSWID